MVSRETFPLTIHKSCFDTTPSPSSAREGDASSAVDSLLEMRFDFKPASLKHGVGTLSVEHNGESTLALRPDAVADAVVHAQRMFHGHVTTPTRARFFLVRQSTAEGGGYVLRRVHEVCQMGLSGSAGHRRKAPPSTAAAAAKLGAVERLSPPKKRAKRLPDKTLAAVKRRQQGRRERETSPASDNESDGSSSAASSSDDSVVDMLEADLLG